MDETPDRILRCPTSRLARLLEDRPVSPWSPEDYEPLLAHELRTPLGDELDRLARDPALPTAEKAWLARSFAELFMHPEPPVFLLRQVKDFAKRQRVLEGYLPQEVATVLYYAAVAVALGKRGERISSLTDSELAKGIDWVLAREWVHRKLKGVFTDARRRLNDEHRG
ncbi:MAG: hypothetical protein AB9869_21920 [Verrucomicrobiia bacterium]